MQRHSMDKGLMSWKSVERLSVEERRGARGKKVQVKLRRDVGVGHQGGLERLVRHHKGLTGS